MAGTNWQKEMLTDIKGDLKSLKEEFRESLNSINKNITNIDKQSSIMQAKVNDHHKTLYGNGKPGILQFINELKGAMSLGKVLIGSSIVVSLVSVGIASLPYIS